MLNERGFREEQIQCSVCEHMHIVAQDDPHDDGECPVCVENNILAAQRLDELLDSMVPQLEPFNEG